jgi:hypothetical protein
MCIKSSITALALSSVFLTSCATIVNSSHRPTAINSSPSKMAFKVIDSKGVIVSQGVTPSTATLNRSSGYFKPGKYTVEISKNGRVVGKETISAELSGWYFGNLLFGGLIGMLIVDPLSGAMYKMPESVTVNSASSVAFYETNRELQIVDISTLTPAQRNSLVRI